MPSKTPLFSHVASNSAPDDGQSDTASPRAGSVATLALVLLRLTLSVCLAIVAFPAISTRPLLSLSVAAATFVIVIAIGLAPRRTAPTVHDRQLDIILLVGTVVVGAWLTTTWSALDSAIATVASLLLFAALALLLVGTRTVWRLWPAALAWLSAATGGVPMICLAAAALIGASLGAVRRRTFRLDRAQLGAPPLWVVAPWVVLVTLGGVAVGWGLVR